MYCELLGGPADGMEIAEDFGRFLSILVPAPGDGFIYLYTRMETLTDVCPGYNVRWSFQGKVLEAEIEYEGSPE